jgi:hypothetical protein
MGRPHVWGVQRLHEICDRFFLAGWDSYFKSLKKSGKNLGLWEISCTFAEYEMNIHFEAYGSIEKSADWRTEL